MVKFDASLYLGDQLNCLESYLQNQPGLFVDGGLLQDNFLHEFIEGYAEANQSILLQKLKEKVPYSIYYVIDGKHLVRDKQFDLSGLSFEKYCLKQGALINSSLHISVQFIITMLDQGFIPPHVENFRKILENLGYKVYYSYRDQALTITDAHYLLSSYEGSVVPEYLLQHNSIETQRSLLPFHHSDKDTHDSIIVLSELLKYESKLSNLNLIEKYIDQTDKSSLSLVIKKYITHRLKEMNKLVHMGQLEEEEWSRGVERAESLR